LFIEQYLTVNEMRIYTNSYPVSLDDLSLIVNNMIKKNIKSWYIEHEIQRYIKNGYRL
jgi:hypothetical protein